MSLTTALDRYTTAVGSVKAHIEANKAIFDAHEQLVFKLIDAENDLRDAAGEAMTGASNGSHIVTVTPQTQTFVDPDDVKKYVSDTGIQAKLIQTVDRPPRITIQEQK